MSLQTKDQAVGYILRGALKSTVPANELVRVARAANVIVPARSTIKNEDTLDFVSIIGEQLEWSAEQIKELRSEVAGQFDMKTVEEAGDAFEAFSLLFPVLKK